MSGWTGAIALLVTTVFAGKCDRPTYIPDAKPAIALLESVKKCDRFLAIFGYMERDLGIVDGQGRSLFLAWKGRSLLLQWKGRSLFFS